MEGRSWLLLLILLLLLLLLLVLMAVVCCRPRAHGPGQMGKAKGCWVHACLRVLLMALHLGIGCHLHLDLSQQAGLLLGICWQAGLRQTAGWQGLEKAHRWEAHARC